MYTMFKKTISFFISILILAAVFSSCNQNTVYNENVTLPSEGWHKNNAISFNVNIYDSLTNYEFSLITRNSIDYRFSNLYIFLITEFPNGNISRDTIECILANDEGKWLGKGWGDIKENKIALKTGLRFPLTGNYKFLIQQAMRVDTLTGINDVGLSIIKE